MARPHKNIPAVGGKSVVGKMFQRPYTVIKQQIGKKFIYRIHNTQQRSIMQLIRPKTEKEMEPEDEKSKETDINKRSVAVIGEESF